MRVVVGTKNAHKVLELQRILEPLIPGLILEPSPEDSPGGGRGYVLRKRPDQGALGFPGDGEAPRSPMIPGIEVAALDGRPGNFLCSLCPERSRPGQHRTVAPRWPG
jgi:hypothetical protein